MSIDSRHSPHLLFGKDDRADGFAVEVDTVERRRASRARRHLGGHLRPMAVTIKTIIENHRRRAAEIEANTGACRVLMKDGVWLVPESERPPLK